MTKAKALYQVKLILDYLSEDEYNLIPKDLIEYVEDNFEYDENIKIDPNIPLEEQNIDEKAYDYLEKVVKAAEKNKKENVIEDEESNVENVENTVVSKTEKDYETEEVRNENIRLKNLIETLRKENEKIEQAKGLIGEYKEALNNLKEELSKKEEEVKKLKEDNVKLYNIIDRLPKLIKKIFVKEANMLNDGK